MVYLGKHIITEEEMAIKVMMSSNITMATDVQQAFKESQLLQKFKHESIVKLYNVFQLADTKTVLMMEYVRGGTLLQYIEDNNGQISEEDA